MNMLFHHLFHMAVSQNFETVAFLPVNDISRFQQLPDFWVGPSANPSEDLSKKMALRLCIYHWGLWFIYHELVVSPPPPEKYDFASRDD